MKQQSSIQDHLHAAARKIALLHIFFTVLYSLQTIIFHAAKVVTPEVTWWRWMAASALLFVAASLWMIARKRHLPVHIYQASLWLIILADLAFAAFNVYVQRGYASNSVILFLIPIVVAAAFASRSTLIGTALLASATYAATTVSYFHLNFNEGYLSELYGEMAINTGVFFLTALLLWASTHKHK